MWTASPTDTAAERAVQALVSLAAGGEARGCTRAALAELSPAAWASVSAILEENRLVGRVGHALAERGLDGDLPAEVARELRRTTAEKSARNTERMARYALVAAELERRGVEPILLKSAALVALLGPRQAAHEMSDVDVYVRPEQVAETEAVLGAHGLVAMERLEHASDFRDQDDLLRVDLHHRFDMFGRRPLHAMATVVPTDYASLPVVRLLEPDAMLAHLAVHLHEHRGHLGYRLRWICDFALALGLWRARFRWHAIASLLPGRRARLCVARTVAFCGSELGVAPPPDLCKAAEAVEPFTFAEVLRSQRLVPWQLSTLRGWARLGATAVGARPLHGRPLPRTADFGGTIRDERSERRSFARLEAFETRLVPASAPVRAVAITAGPALPFAAPAGVAAERH